MRQINETSSLYADLAHKSSTIYFTMQMMNLIQPYYDYSLSFFNDSLQQLLQQLPEKDPDQRIALLTDNLFAIIYERI